MDETNDTRHTTMLLWTKKWIHVTIQRCYGRGNGYTLQNNIVMDKTMDACDNTTFLWTRQ